MEGLCLECNNTIGKPNEPRLKELDLRDPEVDSRTLRTPVYLTVATDNLPVITHFHHQWKGPEPVKIGMVYEIRLPRSVAKVREAYKYGFLFHPT